MIDFELFNSICLTFQNKLDMYREVDAITDGHNEKEYYKNAVEPIVRTLIINIIGTEILHKTIDEGWDTIYVEEYVLDKIREFFVSTKTLRIVSEVGSIIYKSFNEVYNIKTIYNWLCNMSKEDLTTVFLPYENLASGYKPFYKTEF